MSTSPKLLAGAAFLAALGLSAVAAQTIVRTLEDRSVEAVATRLEDGGFDWAEVLGDGLQVVLEGEAPTEAARFEAISAASQVVHGARVIDNMRVAPAREIAPPDFALEILRNDAGVSLIGLLPAQTDRRDLLREFSEAASGQEVSDLLQTADYPVPAGWEPALEYALHALELLPRAKISVSVDRVSIEAISDSPEEQRRLESELARSAPEGVRLALAISAPRPVITPFILRASLEGGRLAFDACSADTEEARDAILTAATAAGAEGQLECRLGLGSPSPEWGSAAAAGIAALHELGGGTLTLSDADMTLAAAPGTDRALFDRVAGELDGALPDVFALEATRPLPATATEAEEGPPEFRATLAEEGRVRLEGQIDDSRMNGLVRAFAQARFGAEDVQLATRLGDGSLPDGWPMRVLVGIEALSRLHEGRVTVTPDTLHVAGRSGNAAARDEIAARAVETLGPNARLEIEVTYDEALDPLAALPSPAECLAKITSVTEAAKITFDPGSAIISAQGEPVIEAIAEILRSCPDLRLRIAGYTDSQGRESTNLELSQSRAEAVLAALLAERVPVSGFEARGYGEVNPIASNETEPGREANRRIEFSLLGAESPSPPIGTALASVGAPAVPASEPLMERPASPPNRPQAVETEGTAVLAEVSPNGEEPDAGAPTAGESTGAPAETTGVPAGESLAPETLVTVTRDGAEELGPAIEGDGAAENAEALEEAPTSTSDRPAGPSTANTEASNAPQEGRASIPADTPPDGVGVAPVRTTAEDSVMPAASADRPEGSGATASTD